MSVNTNWRKLHYEMQLYHNYILEGYCQVDEVLEMTAL